MTAQSNEAARHNVKVLVCGESGAPLQNARVIICDGSGRKVAQKLAGQNGPGLVIVAVPPGMYSATVSASGYESVNKDIKTSDTELDLGTVNLKVSDTLNAAKVVTKSLLRRTPDRYIYDVSRDSTAGKVSMMEMMPKIPLLAMGQKNGKLEYAGVPISNIIIDGEENGLVNARRQHPMEFIKANYMRTIELIMPGSPEYNNTEPILLITLSRDLPIGFSGQLSADVSTKNEYKPSVDLVANTPYIGIGVAYGYSYAKRPALTSTITTQMLADDAEYASTLSESESRTESDSYSVSINLFKELFDGKLNISALMNTSYSRSSTFRESLFEGYNPDGSLKTSETSSFREDCLSPFRFNCFMTLSGKFGPTSARNRNGKFSWSARYVFRDVENTTNSTSAMSSLNKNREHQLVCSVNLPKINDNPLGLGLKLDAGYFNRSISERTEYMSASNIESLSYLQQVAFLSAATGGYALKGMFMYRAGVTLEYLENKGQFGQNATSSPLDYGEFNAIPNVILRMGYKRNRFNLKYRMNVKRPSISMLNPYVTVYDNYNTSGGNPSLKGEKRHNLSFSYSYSFNVTWMRGLNAGIHYSHTSNAISRFTELSSEGVAHTTYANIGSCDAVGAHVNATFVPVKSLTLILGMRYSHSRYALPDSKVNSYGTPNLDLSAKWSPKWFELRGDFRLSPFNAGAQTTKYQLYPMLNLSISRYFEKIHLGVSASVNDVVHWGTSTRNTIQGSNFIRHSVNQTDGIIANFRIYWRFGKYQAMPTAASIAYD